MHRAAYHFIKTLHIPSVMKTNGALQAVVEEENNNEPERLGDKDETFPSKLMRRLMMWQQWLQLPLSISSLEMFWASYLPLSIKSACQVKVFAHILTMYVLSISSSQLSCVFGYGPDGEV